MKILKVRKVDKSDLEPVIRELKKSSASSERAFRMLKELKSKGLVIHERWIQDNIDINDCSNFANDSKTYLNEFLKILNQIPRS